MDYAVGVFLGILSWFYVFDSWARKHEERRKAEVQAILASQKDIVAAVSDLAMLVESLKEELEKQHCEGTSQ